MTLEFLRRCHRRGAAVRSDRGRRMAAIPVLAPDVHSVMRRRHPIRKILRRSRFLVVRHHVSQFNEPKCHISNGLKDIHVLMAQVEAEIDLRRSCVHGYAPWGTAEEITNHQTTGLPMNHDTEAQRLSFDHGFHRYHGFKTALISLLGASLVQRS